MIKTARCICQRRRMEPMVDLKDAIQRHAQWKFRFREALLKSEQMTVETISKDDHCELGKWLKGEARTLYGQCKAYADCLAKHTAFHVEAGKLAVVVNAKHKQEAERMLANGSAFSEASRAVVVSLIELQHEIEL